MPECEIINPYKRRYEEWKQDATIVKNVNVKKDSHCNTVDFEHLRTIPF